jgi:LacI family fructose operon transcriptional repressor
VRRRRNASDDRTSAGRKPTIYDIARLSGASPSTVSAVLSGRANERRIKSATELAIKAIAAEAGYSPNLQARGLRSARSGLVGMIIPNHEDRFFSSLSQSFDTQARQRGHCPVIASTLRTPEEEARIVKTLISYKIDALLIAGATDSEALGALCTAAHLPHLFVDLPGRHAPSVVTDNLLGAERLTRKLLRDCGPVTTPRARPCFLGGIASDFATASRLVGFRKVCGDLGLPSDDDQILLCGYASRPTTATLEALYARLGGLPTALFVNSLPVFEGALRFLAALPERALRDTAIGCFDYHPFAAFLPFPVTMVRQDADALVARAYELLDAADFRPRLIAVEPRLIEPRTLYEEPASDLG